MSGDEKVFGDTWRFDNPERPLAEDVRWAVIWHPANRQLRGLQRAIGEPSRELLLVTVPLAWKPWLPAWLDDFRHHSITLPQSLLLLLGSLYRIAEEEGVSIWPVAGKPPV